MINNLENNLSKLVKEDLLILKRFLEIVIREYNFNKNIINNYFNLDVRTIKEANLPIATVRSFVDNLLVSNAEGFTNINSLHKKDYAEFEKYREFRKTELYDMGEEMGYTKEEIEKEIRNEFDGIFIKNPNEEFIKSIKKTIKDIESILNKEEYKIKIYINNYLIYRFLRDKKLETEIKDTSRKLLLDYLLDNNHRILSDELAKYILIKLKLPKERKPTSGKISNDIKDINKNFRLQLEFPANKKEDKKYRLILPSDRKGYHINYKTFDIERIN